MKRVEGLESAVRVLRVEKGADFGERGCGVGGAGARGREGADGVADIDGGAERERIGDREDEAGDERVTARGRVTDLDGEAGLGDVALSHAHARSFRADLLDDDVEICSMLAEERELLLIAEQDLEAAPDAPQELGGVAGAGEGQSAG